MVGCLKWGGSDALNVVCAIMGEMGKHFARKLNAECNCLQLNVFKCRYQVVGMLGCWSFVLKYPVVVEISWDYLMINMCGHMLVSVY